MGLIIGGFGRPGRQEIHEINQLDKLTNYHNIAVANIGEKDDLTNPFQIGLTKENAATSAKVNGVKDVMECVYSYGDYIALFPILATHWGAF